jgi:hypothetical protein
MKKSTTVRIDHLNSTQSARLEHIHDGPADEMELERVHPEAAENILAKLGRVRD